MFDHLKEYETEIEPLLKKAYDICNLYRIPFFAAACVGDSNNSTEYRNFVLSPASAERTLKDDRITGHINVANGFDTVPPRKDLGGTIDAYVDGIEDVPEDWL